MSREYDKITMLSDVIVTLYKESTNHFYICHIKDKKFSGLYQLHAQRANLCSPTLLVSMDSQVIMDTLIIAIIDGYYINGVIKDRHGDFKKIKKSTYEKYRNILKDKYNKHRVGLDISLRDFIYEIFIFQNSKTLKKLMSDINSYYLPF